VLTSCHPALGIWRERIWLCSNLRGMIEGDGNRENRQTGVVENVFVWMVTNPAPVLFGVALAIAMCLTMFLMVIWDPSDGASRARRPSRYSLIVDSPLRGRSHVERAKALARVRAHVRRIQASRIRVRAHALHSPQVPCLRMVLTGSCPRAILRT